jgi:hypothetical protein
MTIAIFIREITKIIHATSSDVFSVPEEKAWGFRLERDVINVLGSNLASKSVGAKKN